MTRPLLFFIAILISCSAGAQLKDIVLKLDRKIKGPLKICYCRTDEDRPALTAFSGSLNGDYDLTDEISLDRGLMSGHYKIWIEQERRKISGDYFVLVKTGDSLIIQVTIKYFETRNGDTINRFDNIWRKQGKWIEYGDTEGNYVDDKKEGYWISKYGQVLMDEGWYQNGKKEGLWIDRSFEGVVVVISTYKNGLLNGPLNVYDDSGRISKMEEYKNNLLWNINAWYDTAGRQKEYGYIKNGTGYLCGYGRGGKVVEETHFKNGIKDGLSRSWRYDYTEDWYVKNKKVKTIEYYPGNMIKKHVVEYFKDNKQKEYSYDENGKLEFLFFRTGNALYYSIHYYSNGKVKTKGPFKSTPFSEGMYNSYRNGEWKEFSEDGKETWVVIYDRDEVISRKKVK